MYGIVSQEDLRRQAGEVIRTFGLMTYVRVLTSHHKGKGLLQQITEKYQREGIPMPGPLGQAYRISALLEFRAARIYDRLARHFQAEPPARAFFEELRDEELEHGRLMVLCLYTLNARVRPSYVPSLRDPEVRALLRELRAQERRVEQLTLDEALDLTAKLEASEINMIFDRLLAQTQHPQSGFFIAQLGKAGGHAEAVPKRIQALREVLGI